MCEGNPCRDFFERHKGSSEKVPALQREPDALLWEALTASLHSPGVVASDEQVLRLSFQPLHIDPESRSLKPSAVSDAKDKGFSVDRLGHTTKEASIELGRKRALDAIEQGRTPRELQAVSILSVALVRSIQIDESRAFGVYDTAREDNRAHADICLLVPGKQQWRSARFSLLELCDASLEILDD